MGGISGQWKFEYLLEQIDPDKIRAISNLSNEALKLTMAGMICEIVGGLEHIPVKSYRTQFAKRWIMAGKGAKEVMELTGISKRGFYYLKKSINNCSNSK